MKLVEPACRLCKNHGHNFPDETRACWSHTTPQWRERLNDLDRRAKKIGIQRWPYGPDIDIQMRIDLLDWAEPLGLKLALSRCNNLHWLRDGRCPNTAECTPLPWMDHTTRWMRRGKPALVLTQPYSSPERLREKMKPVLDDDALRVEIKPGWYGHGTIGAFVWRAQAYPKENKRS